MVLSHFRQLIDQNVLMAKKINHSMYIIYSLYLKIYKIFEPWLSLIFVRAAPVVFLSGATLWPRQTSFLPFRV